MKGEKSYKKASEILELLYNSTQFSHTDKVEMYGKYLNLIKSSAYLGNPKAQFELALHYEEFNFFGRNKKYNKNRVLYWYKKSCNGNMADACNNLATIYESECRIEDAITFYKKAIELGNDLAENNLKGLIKNNQ